MNRTITLLCLLITTCLIILLTATTSAQYDPYAYPTPEPHCPPYAPTCHLGWPNPTDTPTPTFTPLPTDWQGDGDYVVVADLRIFSTTDSIMLVDPHTGAVVLYLDGLDNLATLGLLGDSGPVAVYRLVTGEYQINVLQPDGITKVAIFDSLPLTNPQYSEFGG